MDTEKLVQFTEGNPGSCSELSNSISVFEEGNTLRKKGSRWAPVKESI